MASSRVSSIPARARAMLSPPAGKNWSALDVQRALKRFRKIEEARLRMLHRAGGGGVEVCEMRAALVDAALICLWDHIASEHKDTGPVSLVATGGYGREQMNPSSDVDILLLLPGNSAQVPVAVAAMVSQFLTAMWDSGFKVGDSATRSVGETLKRANEDNQVKTALIEARLVAGNSSAFEDLRKRFDRECMMGKETAFLKLRQQDLIERHHKQGVTPFVQEPNVKTGCGGLRDYHNLLWTAYAKLRATNLRDLVKAGMLTPTSQRELSQAYDFLLRVRTELHYIEKREQDVLTLRLQGVVATNLGYRHKTMLGRIEAFMREYYTHTRNILQRSNELMDRFHLETVEQEQRGMVLGFLARRRAGRPEKFDGFISKNNRLYPEHDRIFKDDPPRLMRLFVHTQQRQLRLSPELFQLVQKSFPLVDQTFRYSKAARESFNAILSRKGEVSRVLRQMHRVGFLGRWMPEFGALDCLVQHEFFHRYTADEHTLRTIDKLDELAGEPHESLGFFQKLFHELQEPGILYLALLLHDTGRAANSRNHSDASADLASRVCRRFQIKGERRRLIMFLVDHHLTLYQTATSKNLDDPQVIEEFAKIARDRSFLDALMVMSCADSRGTSEGSWTSWKESLLRQLYNNAARYLDDPSDYTRRVTAPLLALQAEVMGNLDESYGEETAAHFTCMPRSYFNFREAAVIAQHLRVFREFFQKLAEGKAGAGLLPTLEWIEHPEQGSSELVVVSWDRHLLLARIAGALAANNINILGADLFQRSDDVVLDIFRVCTANLTPVSNDRTKARVRTLIEEAFKNTNFDFSEAIKVNRAPLKEFESVAGEVPQRVQLNTEISAEYTVLELQVLDRIGLLYDVFMAIGQHGLSVCHARINTEKGVAIDAIYLQDSVGKKITDRKTLLALRETVERAVFV
ncbi:MAG: [protein-PII] uridylyltransferase [Verrucomicrobia bacterium]|nr:[protein-PII] uridylyltransferase [Verrucomicrobiota bacterium]